MTRAKLPRAVVVSDGASAARCPTCDREGCDRAIVAAVGGPAPACARHAVDWRARALAAETELAGASAAICDVSDTIRRALAGDEGGMSAPYHGPLAAAVRYPSIAADLRRLDEVLTIGSPRAAAMRDAAAQWAKVAPLIERLRAAVSVARHDYATDDDETIDPRVTGHELVDAVTNLLAAAEATP